MFTKRLFFRFLQKMLFQNFLLNKTYLTSNKKLNFTNRLEKRTNPSWLMKYFYKKFASSECYEDLQKYSSLIEKLTIEVQTYNANFIEARLKSYKKFLDGDDEKTKLDEDQRKAVIVDDKHNLVVAGAGSGKTAVLTKRIAYLIQREDSVSSHRILAV